MTDDLIDRMLQAAWGKALPGLTDGQLEQAKVDMRAALAAIPYNPATQVIVDRELMSDQTWALIKAAEAGNG